VHVLDDGFQHFDLVRDVDLLVAPATLDDTRTLPFGRFREPLDAAASADALLVEIEAPQGRAEALRHQSSQAEVPVHQPSLAQGFSPVAHDSAAQLAARLKVPIAFEFSRRIAGPPADRPAFAFAGIARPERFFADLEKAGWRLTGRRAFADHHRYSDREIDDIAAAAAASGAQVILTTEKDFVRLRPGVSIVPVPLEVSIAPSFGPWLAERLRTARASGSVA
jgi:tetraacyldisaccharide 4'-kinase